jgi:ribosomal protein S12 methylthiotransferase accessory factor
VDDPYVFADLDISELSPYHVLHDLVAKFSSAGIPLIIKDVTSDIGIPTFSVSSVEWLSHNYGYLTEGYGTHPQSGIALVRAITELSQSRAANIHGARDDLRKILYSEDNTDEKKAWQFMQSNKTVRLSDIRSFSNDDILDDIKLILDNLRRAGIRRAIIVDLSNGDIKIPVVRAILPGLETFKITKSIMGWRARRYLPGNG